MRLYEVNQEIQRLLLLIEPDPETGEVPDNCDELLEQLNALTMKRSDILEYLAKVVLDIRADITALKAEERRLKDRRTILEHKEDRLMQVLDRECAGQKTDCGVATISYRKTTRVDVSDAEKAVRWLKRNKYTDCYRIPEPEVSKTNVRRLLQDGVNVPGVVLTQDMSCSLR